MLTAKEQQWNQTVQEHVDTIKKIITWVKQEEDYAEEHKDWFTERGQAKVRHQLELAVVELYDMQYFDDASSLNNWRKAECIDV